MKLQLQKDKEYKGKITLKKLLSSKELRLFLIEGVIVLKLLNPILKSVESEFEMVSSYIEKNIETKIEEKEIIKEFSMLMNLETTKKEISYDLLKEVYDQMDELEKNTFITNAFEWSVQKNTYFTNEEKEYLKEYQTNLLNEYGYLYDFDNIFYMCNRLDDVEVLRNQEFNSELTVGTYNKNKNLIKLKEDNDYETLCHEIEHTMNYNSKIPEFIVEAMNSSTDLEYLNNESYNNEMRSQVLFLGEIIGRANLIDCYLNDDIELLTKLIGKESIELFTIFEQELECIHDNGYIDIELTKKAQEKLKNIYETKFNKKVSDDELIYIIYSSCINDSEYKIISTIFYEDEFKYYGISPKYYLINGTIISYNNSEYIMNVNTKESIYKLNYITNSELKNNPESLVNKKINYLFKWDRVFNLTYGEGTIEDRLRAYLQKVGVSNIDFWVYNILNNNCVLAFNIDGLSEYDSNTFFEDLSKIYQEKFDYLCSLNSISEIFIDLDFILTQQNGNLEANIDSKNLYLFLNKLNPIIDTNKILIDYYSRKNEDYQYITLYNYENNIYDESIKKLSAMFGKEFKYIIESKDIIGYLEKYCKDFCEEKEISKYINIILNNNLDYKIDYNQDLFINAFYQRLKKDYNHVGIISLICDLKEIMSDEEIGEVLFKISNLFNDDNIKSNLLLYTGFSWNNKDIYNNNSWTRFYYHTSSNMITLPYSEKYYYYFSTITNKNVEITKIEYKDNGFVTYYFDKNLNEDDIIINGVGFIEDFNNKETISSTNKVKKKILN